MVHLYLYVIIRAISKLNYLYWIIRFADFTDRSSMVKLFVGSVPRTATEEEVSYLFDYFPNFFSIYMHFVEAI